MSLAGVALLVLLTSCRLAADALPVSAAGADDALDWPALEARASAATGRAWTSAVEHFELSDKELDARIEIETDLVLDPARLTRSERELATLGLAPRGIDLRATLREVESGSVLGLYSTVGDRLYVAPENVLPGEGSTVEGLAVHELVHALQAQHSKIGLTTLGLLEHDDLAFALGAAMEGDALLAEAIDAESLGRGAVPTSREQIEADWDVDTYRFVFPEVPDVLIDAWVMPYPLGMDLARRDAQEGRRAEGGDALLLDPPLSSEQLLQPEKWLDPAQRDLPVFVELPTLESPECTEYGRNTLGAIGWSRFLAQSGPGESAVSREALLDAVRGWGGDRYALFDCGELEHIAIAYVGDTPRDADELAVALAATLRRLAAGSAFLAKELDLRVEGLRVQATLGFSAAQRQRLWEETKRVRFENLDAFLEAHPEVLERAASLRADALRSGEEEDAGR